MKHPFTVGLFCVLVALAVSSCAILPQRSNTGWGLYPETGEKQDLVKRSLIRVYVGEARIDKALGARSIQEELHRVASLDVLRRGYQLALSEGEADYGLEFYAVERDFTQGWQNRRSVSLEVSLWRYPDDKGSAEKVLVAMGRSAMVGQGSLSSSLDMEELLRKALDMALNRALQK